jgi:plasmid stability protein
MYSGHVAKNIQIRNVPDDVHEVYKRRAAAAGMSLQEYLLSDLSVRATRLTMDEAMARIDRHRRGSTVTVDDVVQAIREDRESH